MPLNGSQLLLIILGGIQKALIDLEHFLVVGVPVPKTRRQQRLLRLYVAIELVDKLLPAVYLELVCRFNGFFPRLQLRNGDILLHVRFVFPQFFFGVLQILLRLLDFFRIRHPLPLSRSGVVLPHRPLVPGVEKCVLLLEDIQLQFL